MIAGNWLTESLYFQIARGVPAKDTKKKQFSVAKKVISEQFDDGSFDEEEC